MPQRERLPNRHECDLVSFKHEGHSFIGQIGRYDDGRLAEVFISPAKAGSDMETQIRDTAIILSHALQHGVPLATLRKSLTKNPNGTSSGPVGKLLDIIAADERARK